ncbi:MAG: hypothetical protein ACI9LM_000117 [Alteromonadaceae bacterium]|jgi:hypothetical protein
MNIDENKRLFDPLFLVPTREQMRQLQLKHKEKTFYDKKPRILASFIDREMGNTISVTYPDFKTIQKFVFKAIEREPKENQRSMVLAYIKKFNSTGEKTANTWLRDIVEPHAVEAKNEVLQLESNSLVKRSESPTDSFSDIYKRDFQLKKVKARKRKAKRDGERNELLSSIKKDFATNNHTCPEPLSLASRKNISQSVYFDSLSKVGTISSETKTCVRMYHQEWSNNYKMGLEIGALGSKSAPPLTSGERITESLSSKAVKSVLESGAYLSTTRGGYTTFATLTFNQKARDKLNNIICVSKSKTKTYHYKIRRLNPSSGRMKTYKEKYDITCYDGIPADLVNDENGSIENLDAAESNPAYVNGIPASGAFCSVEFKPEATIGSEVSRFCDGAQKMYQRGWTARFIENESKEYPWGSVVCYDSESSKEYSWGKVSSVGALKQEPACVMHCPEFVDPLTASGYFDEDSELIPFNPRKHSKPEYVENMYGHQEKSAPLDYMWVAEMPDNKKGEKNPHVHIMMRWNVPKPLFRAWADRLETIWGHGFAKLEKLKTPEAASNYLLKAVGYLTKGGSSEQGIITGNRYNISASARAPKWECIGEFYADNFIAILGELREKLHRKKARINSTVNACIQQRDKEKGLVKKLSNVNRSKAKFSEKRQVLIEKLKGRLLDGDIAIKEASEQKNALPYINDFSLGQMNETQATDFLSWAMRERFWNCEVKTNRYNTWDELKANTIEAIKENRAYWRGYSHILETSELTWQWAEYTSNFDLISDAQNVAFDENGNQWELVA